MDHLCGNACITNAEESLQGQKMVTRTFWTNGIKMTSTPNLGWTEERIIQYDEIALEDQSHVATKEERSRNGELRDTIIECKGYTRTIESAQ